MKLSTPVLWLLSVPVILTLPSSRVFAEDGVPTGSVTVNTQTDGKTILNLNDVDWQIVIDNVFGTIDKDGLLDGTGQFQLRIEDLELTAAQAAFFTAIDSPQSLTALIEAAETRHGNIRMEGTIDGQPFELKLAGRELKIEGLTLTEAQRQALIAELSGISGLKEMKIQAIVDGRMTVTKYQGGHEKLEIRDERGRPVHAGKAGSTERVERSGRNEKIEKAEKLERIERIERIERPEKPERPERPERGETGRR